MRDLTIYCLEKQGQESTKEAGAVWNILSGKGLAAAKATAGAAKETARRATRHSEIAKSLTPDFMKGNFITKGLENRARKAAIAKGVANRAQAGAQAAQTLGRGALAGGVGLGAAGAATGAGLYGAGRAINRYGASSNSRSQRRERMDDMNSTNNNLQNQLMMNLLVKKSYEKEAGVGGKFMSLLKGEGVDAARAARKASNAGVSKAMKKQEATKGMSTLRKNLFHRGDKARIGADGKELVSKNVFKAQQAKTQAGKDLLSKEFQTGAARVGAAGAVGLAGAGALTGAGTLAGRAAVNKLAPRAETFAEKRTRVLDQREQQMLRQNEMLSRRLGY